jgi:tetratricopeptide (TPR) repeat protein
VTDLVSAHPLIDLTERALAVTADVNTPERARLLIVLTEQTEPLDWRTLQDRGLMALAAARTFDDDALVADAITSTYPARWQPDNLDDRIRDSVEAIVLADGLGDPLRQFEARYNRVDVLFETDAVDERERRLAEMAQLIADSKMPHPRFQLAVATAASRLVTGPLIEAEAAIEEILAIGLETGYPNALAVYGGMLFELRREQGRVDEIADLFIDAARDNPSLAVLRATVGLLHCEMGDFDGARAVFETDDETLDAYPYNATWLTSMAIGADTAVALDDRDAAARFLTRLAPHRTRTIFNGGTFFGATSRPIARLHVLLGNPDEADAAFEFALDHNRRLRAPYWIACTELDYAKALAERSGQSSRVMELAQSALEVAKRRGFPVLERRAVELLS